MQFDSVFYTLPNVNLWGNGECHSVCKVFLTDFDINDRICVV